jgi:pyrroline-5-carboxylate reductase
VTYGFIGCGCMAGAIVQGCLDKKFFTPEQVWICEKDPDLLEKRKREWGVHGGTCYEECAAFAELVILAVKPNILPGILPEVGTVLQKFGRVVVSIAAGQSLQRLEDLMGVPIPISRVMPNINAQVGAAMTAISGNALLLPEQKQAVLHLFRAVGDVLELEEEYFEVFGVLAGCSPAFVFMFIDSLARGAQKLGMNKAQAIRIAAQTVLGSAKNLLAQEGIHPWTLIDQVCSPGGTTIEGITALQANGFEHAIVSAVEAAAQKHRQL